MIIITFLNKYTLIRIYFKILNIFEFPQGSAFEFFISI